MFENRYHWAIDQAFRQQPDPLAWATRGRLVEALASIGLTWGEASDAINDAYVTSRIIRGNSDRGSLYRINPRWQAS